MFTGYAGLVWQAIYEALVYYETLISAAATNNTPSSVASVSDTMLDSLLNAVDIINAAALLSGWQAEYANLQAVSALPLGAVDPVSAAYFNNRLAAYAAGITGLSAVIPAPASFPLTANTLTNGAPALPYIGLLEFLENFAYETPPVGLTSANFAADAEAVPQAFQVVATNVQIYQGNFPTQIYDTVTREIAVTTAAAYLIESFTSGTVASNIGTTNAWNQIVALPAMVMASDILNSAPSSELNQQSACIRNAMLTIASQISLFILSVEAPASTVLNQATLQVGEGLMDLAARTLGDFTQWTAIAELNNLQPPYVGSFSAPGIAVYGSQLLLPTPGAGRSATGAVPSYSVDFLGTDLYIGPINGDMPAWTGDFQVISGYNNLAWALGRRLQTTLGSLLYHSDYGSRIPPEIGMVLNSNTAGQITAFGSSAILTDPRVSSVLNAISTILTANQGVSFSATVQPAGAGSQPTTLNQVITPGA